MPSIDRSIYYLTFSHFVGLMSLYGPPTSLISKRRAASGHQTPSCPPSTEIIYTRVALLTILYSFLLFPPSTPKAEGGGGNTGESNRRASSYAPKYTNPPIVIHITRGANPENSVAPPSSRTTLLKTSTIPRYFRPCTSFSKINLVLITSSGVVIAAAMAPAKDPQVAAWKGETACPCSVDQAVLAAS